MEMSFFQDKSLIDKRIDNPDSLTDRENNELDFALNRKYCNCVEKIKYNSRKSNKSKSKRRKSSNNPYAICTKSIYKNRDLLYNNDNDIV